MRTLDRFVQIRSLWLATFLSLGLAAPVSAAIIFTEDYEVAALTNLTAKGWSINCGSTPCTTDIVSSPVHGGSKALRMTYIGNHDYPGGGSDDTKNSKITKNFTGVPELYERYYVRYDPIDTSQPSGFSNSGKQHYLNVASTPNFWTGFMFNNKQLISMNQTTVNHTCPGGHTDVTCTLRQNMANVYIAWNRWYCIETHHGPGIVEIWVDGQLTTRHLAPTVMSPATYFSIQIYRQGADNMYRYEDDFVVSTTRVGCSGNGNSSSDTTAPATPTGFTVRQ